jgi:UDP-4-amino-4,6-dideoxy-N-acetyl-beta-L-altrosamine transaminase
MTNLPPTPSFLPYGKQVIEQDDIEAVTRTLLSDYLTTGPKIEEFEKKLSEILGAKEVVAVGNGTQALHLACIGVKLQPGDFAVVPSTTFLATANAVRYCGADILFCDVDPNTGIIDLNHLEQILIEHKDKTIKAVLPVHLGGQLANLKKIKELSEKYKFSIIADSCHAIGSTMKDYKAGSCKYEDMSTFSFHPVKTIAMGEGGAISLNDSETAKQLRSLRSHGMKHKPEKGLWLYEMNDLGYNYRVTDIQCALGLSQLNKIERFIEKRRSLAKLYDDLLEPLAPIIKPPCRIKEQNPAWHLYALRIDFKSLGILRNELMIRLKEFGVGTQVHYIPVHTQPYYQKLYGSQKLIGAELFYHNTLSLPLFPSLEESDMRYVVETLKRVCGL